MKVNEINKCPFLILNKNFIKFENGVFTLIKYHTPVHSVDKKQLLFSVHTMLKKFKSVLITGNFGFVFEENLGREIIQKALFSKCFPSRPKCKETIFKFLQFEERF